MSSLKHLSMRVPWRDRAWDHHVCNHPQDNSSCLLLKNIGARRDDDYELHHAGQDLDHLKLDAIPCLSERGTFMSPNGYQVTKRHPYATYEALTGHLQPTVVSLPGYAFEAVPFRWLARQSFEEDIWPDWRADYDPAAEDRVKAVLGLKRSPTWIMDGRNQQAVIREFFEPVTPGQSLVFTYLKHSPFQEDVTRRLLVGAALVDDVQLPGFWNQAGTPPFDSSMWETTVTHSLRPDQKRGILLPYQQLLPLLDAGTDITAALAWAPEDTLHEFSFVTEHVSSDSALDALQALRDAATGMRDLGIDVPNTALAWVDAQIHALWDERGPTPGLAAVLSHLQIDRAYLVASALHQHTADPWQALEDGFADPSTWPAQVRDLVPDSVGIEWQHTDPVLQTVLKLLSTMDLRPDQIDLIMSGATALDLDPEELIDDPYYASICTHDDLSRISFATVDRALFPAAHARWATAVPDACRMTDPRDRRRVQALLVEGLHARAAAGDTIASQTDLITWANAAELSQPCQISTALLKGHQLDPASLNDTAIWSPLYGATLGADTPAYKLLQHVEHKDAIVPVITPRLQAPQFPVGFDARAQIDATLAASGQPAAADADEAAARAEKAAGLAELYRARVSVLVGPAGTGKTTLLKALADLPDVAKKGVLLLAPTGKASVQLSTKVGREARTIASFLINKNGYDWKRDRYQLVDPSKRQDCGLVVIDEASMLTEAMLAATLSALGQVERLVLVGDPRQLPPIGAGRPFVDLVNFLRPASLTGPARVGASYVELTVSRRQGGSHRDDVLLAQWFGEGDLGPGADTVWERLRTGTTTKHLEHVTWTGGDIVRSLDAVLDRELDWTGHPDRETAFKLTYGGTLSPDGKYLNWHTGRGGAAARAEDWQILSPTRSRAFGVMEINRHIKRTLRTQDLDLSRRWKYGAWRNSKPIGPEQIVRGDKVMQTRNDSHMKSYPPGSGLDYVANGEIGVVVGSWTNKARSPAHVEFSSQVGARYTYWPSNSEDAALELAWAVTVHKAQGSEFRKTVLVLPAKVNVSRELLYTALTRQTDRVVLLHDGSVDDLVALAHPSRSETARRLTDLFTPAKPRLVEVNGVPQIYDGNLVHVADNGVLVRSKNEVIVADILEKLVPGRWRYEVLLEGHDRSWCRPDFTITTAAGIPVYWEHLGLMNQPTYAERWKQKLAWYAQNGVLPGLQPDGTPIADATKRGGPNGILIWTDDAAGVDKPAWAAMATAILGASEETKAAERKASKKVAARPPA